MRIWVFNLGGDILESGHTWGGGGSRCVDSDGTYLGPGIWLQKGGILWEAWMALLVRAHDK